MIQRNSYCSLLDTFSKKTFVILNISIIVYVIALFIGSIFIPSPYIYTYGESDNCQKISTSEFSSNLVNCSSFYYQDNNFFWAGRLRVSQENQVLGLYIFGINTNNKDLTIQVNMNVWARGQSLDTGNYYMIIDNEESNKIISCKSESSCNQGLVLLYPYLVYDNFDILIQILDYDKIKSFITNLSFRFITIDEVYTRMQISIKTIMSFLSLSLSIFLFFFLKRINRNDLTFEQEASKFITPLLLMFNDPFFIVQIYFPGFLLSLISCNFTALFLSFYLLFLQTQMENIYKEERDIRKAMSKWKFLIFMVYSILLFVLFCVLMLELRDRPIGSSTQKTSNTLWVLFLIVSGLSIAYVIWMVITISLAIRNFANISIGKKWGFFLNIESILVIIFAIFLNAFHPFNIDGGAYFMLILLLNANVFIQIIVNLPVKANLSTQFTLLIPNTVPDSHFIISDPLEDKIAAKLEINNHIQDIKNEDKKPIEEIKS